jgi:hypothetical protein
MLRVGMDPLDQQGLDAGRDRSLRLAVDANDLLPRGSRSPSAPEDPRLDRRRPRGHRDDAVDGDAAIEKRAPERLPCLIRADHAQRHHRGAEGVEVVARVGRAAEPGLLGEVLQDEHRGFPGHALGLAEHVLVGHQVPDHEDAAALEPVDHPEEVDDPRATHRPIVDPSRQFGSWRRGLVTCKSSAPLYCCLTGGKALL